MDKVDISATGYLKLAYDIMQHGEERYQSKKEKADIFQRQIRYLLEGGTIFLESGYTYHIAAQEYMVCLVDYRYKWWIDTLGGKHCSYIADIRESVLPEKALQYYLYTDRASTLVKSYKPAYDNLQEKQLNAILYWLRNARRLFVSGKHDELNAVTLWLMDKGYNTLREAITDIEEQLSGRFTIPG